MNEDWLYKIALSKIPGVGGVIARNLVSYCGGPEGVFKCRKQKLLKVPGIGEQLASNIADPNVLLTAERELDAISHDEVNCIFYLDEAFPERLRHVPQSPVILYARGNMNLNTEHSIAIVGTRKPTPYGKAKCEQIVEELEPYRPLILSGLAYGVDITAHRAALRHHLPTVGVMGSGFGYVYPRAHYTVAKHMMTDGGLITEFGYETGPDRENFPARNRIVAGLADAVIVIESARSGGSMITTAFADAYHKDVFALPGRAGDIASEGCNYLIKTHKAHLIENGQDLAELLRWTSPKPEAGIQRKLFADLTEDEQLIIELIGSDGDKHIDLLATQSKLHLSELASVLLSLEFKGVVRALPGKRYLIVP
ncbi:MAG TPA: DNA-processing protein DprA [Saprospiraceae bacterium]|nr:DNA-processing protein DprA [Saprospiraceae bacterium]